MKVRLLNEDGTDATQSIDYDHHNGTFRWACGADYQATDLAGFLERLTVVSAADERALLLSADVNDDTAFLVRLQRAGRRQAVALFDGATDAEYNQPAWLVSLPDLRKAMRS